jgi:hypothetical protein
MAVFHFKEDLMLPGMDPLAENCESDYLDWIINVYLVKKKKKGQYDRVICIF